MQATRRMRLQAVIQEELAQVVPRELKDPRIPPVTFTAVEVSQDGSQAIVFVAILGGAQGGHDGAPPLSEAGAKLRMKDCIDGLTSASGFLRRHWPVLSVRHIPTLIFREDRGFENANRVYELLKKIAEPDTSAAKRLSLPCDKHEPILPTNQIPQSNPTATAGGALLINKHSDISSFGIIDQIQQQLMQQHGLKRRDLPKLGHGGTLDPFATGLLAVCAGRAVKLARYFLGATKSYEGVIRFGETTVPGDPTAPVSETASYLPESLEQIREMARKLTLQPYLQTPPMHSAKKHEGKPLYELARAGIEVEREPKLCHLYEFEILSYEKPRATFRLVCGSGTYVRTLAQDFGRLLGTVALLEKLERTGVGIFKVENAWTTSQIAEACAQGKRWTELPCWVPFDRLLDGYERASATSEEVRALLQGRQNVLFNILKRTEPGMGPNVAEREKDNDSSCLAIYDGEKLVAVARRAEGIWGIERVFTI